jgi:hypothetical protein
MNTCANCGATFHKVHICGNRGGTRPNAGRPPSSAKFINETTRLPAELVAALDRYATAHGMKSRAEAVRWLLAEALR